LVVCIGWSFLVSSFLTLVPLYRICLNLSIPNLTRIRIFKVVMVNEMDVQPYIIPSYPKCPIGGGGG